ncbi:DNA repair protein RadA [Candidatus Roizmanbacteria bacterium]|nr:MAG: DNA repair protein RadA [Candidatus Roizmanbacteria bacterium]
MAQYVCTNCGEGAAAWMGRCPSCQEWNTFKELKETTTGRSKKVESFATTAFKDIRALDKNRKPTGLFELDRVLGGGIVRGAVILLTGEPGVGKSTLLLQSLKNLTTLYISGEESAEQVKERADRLEMDVSSFVFSDTLQVESIVKGVEDLAAKPDVIVIDSVQTIYTKNVESPPGSVSQLREASAALIRLAKQSGIPIIIVGHVTKEGDVAGPKTLEHMVDAVLNFEGEKISNFRVLRAQKNRFGSTDEIGIFEMKGDGLSEVNNPLAFVDEDKKLHVPGKALVGIMEGKRPLFFEIQTLASTSFLPMPRRVVKGVDYNKVLLLLAVIEKHLKLNLSKYDIYINVIGGVDVKSPAADLGIVASIISSVKNVPLSGSSIFTGEVGLLGEIRKIYGQEKILNEAKRLKFSQPVSSLTARTVKELYQMIL